MLNCIFTVKFRYSIDKRIQNGFFYYFWQLVSKEWQKFGIKNIAKTSQEFFENSDF